jgi:hypothetical protein
MESNIMYSDITKNRGIYCLHLQGSEMYEARWRALVHSSNDEGEGKK